MMLLLILAAGGWEHVETKDGIELYQRDLEGERLVELKLVTVSKLPVEALCSAAYGPSTLDKDEPGISERRLLSNDGGVRITYERISAPVVNDRDYAVRAVKEPMPGGGCRTRFEAANEHAPKLPDGVVRIDKLRGGFTFEPVGDSVVCTYTIFTDPAGATPALLVEGRRKKNAMQWLKMVLARAARSADGGD
jgi:hypothetical protein